ncbi:MAG: flagellar basal body-associated FliL family protein, partial [Pseudomonadota bacterium]
PTLLGLLNIGGSGYNAIETASSNADEAFYDFEEMLVTLRSESGRPQYLKLRISIELASALDTPNIIRLSPRILDDFQAFLRELRVDEISGSEGWYLLKEELLIRINRAVAPIVINEVLITDMVIQ